MSSTDGSGSVGQKIVRGGAMLMVAKLAHVITGFGLYFFLLLVFTNVMGEVKGTESFGAWGATLAVINPLNMMFAYGSLQMASRMTASRGGFSAGLLKGILRAQVLMLVVFLAILQLAIPTLSDALLGDPTYVPYLRIAAAIPLFYGLRCIYQGCLNGSSRFTAQAWLDIGASTLRMVLVLAGAAAGWGTLGAVGGFAAAAVVMAVIAAVTVRPDPDAEGSIRASEIYAFQAKVMLMVLATYCLTSVDLLAVKAFGAEDTLVADRWAGYYTASQKLAQIPMSFVVALAYVMFPYVAKGTEGKSRDEAATIVKNGMRTVLLLLVPCTAFLAATPHATLTFVFPALGRTMIEAGDSIAVVSEPFRYLSAGYALYSVLLIATTIITAGGRPGASLAIIAGTLALQYPLTRWLTEDLGPYGAALGSIYAWSVGVVAAAVVLLMRFGAVVSPLGLARNLGAGAVVFFVCRALPTDGIMVLVNAVIALVLFLALVLVTRELRMSELVGVVRMLLPKRFKR